MASAVGSCAARAAPRALADTAGRARVGAWLAEIAETDAGRQLHASGAAQRGAGAPPAALASSSPYLWDLACADPGRLVALLQSDPEARLAACLGDAAGGLRAGGSSADAMRILRAMKTEAALLIALADIGGLWDVMRVARAVTAVADTAVGGAVHHLLTAAVRAGQLAPRDPHLPETGCGYIVLAMGKMGAGELNYSSDIDLIVLFDPDAPALVAGHVEPGPLFGAPRRASSSRCCRSGPSWAMCFGSTCDCARTRPRRKSRSRWPPASTIMRAGARTGNARR